MTLNKYVLAACIAAVGMAGSALSAREVKVVDGLPKNGGLTVGFERFTEEVGKQTDGRYTGKFFPGSLFGYAEITGALRDGLADIGYSVAGYNRAEFPVTNAVADIATVGSDPVAVAAAMSEFVFTCEPCIQEYLAQNQIVMGFSVIGPYYMYSKPKITTLADFEGKRIRGFGAFGRWVEAMGGTAAVMSANDIYAAMNQGVLDGNTHTLNTLTSISMGEVAEYLLDLPIGLGFGNALFNTNRDLWMELSDEDKRNFLHAAAIGHAVATVTYMNDELAVLNDPSSSGVELVEPSDEVRARAEQFSKEDIATVTKLNSEEFKVADVESHIARFLEIVKKWEGLSQTVDRNDPEAVAKLYYDELYSKIDPAIFE